MPLHGQQLIGSKLLITPENDPLRQPSILRGGDEPHWTTNVDEESIFASLWGSLRDVFFPQKLPPLVLESKPIAVIDRMKTKQNPAATGTAIAIYGGVDSVDCVSGQTEGPVRSPR